MRRSILFLALVLLAACENRTDLYLNLNQAPSIQVRRFGSADQFTQSVLDTMKYSQDSIIFELSVDNDDEISAISITDNEGEVSVQNNTVIYWPDHIGEHNLEVVAVDYYNKQSEPVSVTVRVIDNLPPVALFNYHTNDNFLQIDASDSYDRDARYGGKVVSYKYYVNGIQYGPIANSHFEQYITLFENNTIMVSVMDNDGEWTLSEPEIF